MATHKLLLLPGDGIGPEVMGEVKRLIGWRLEPVEYSFPDYLYEFASRD
jgi:isocitrate/isopropylmalate dehydrogenase